MPFSINCGMIWIILQSREFASGSIRALCVVSNLLCSYLGDEFKYRKADGSGNV